MRKGLKAAGAGVRGKQSKPSPQHPFPKIGKLISLRTTSGTTLLDQIRAKADPRSYWTEYRQTKKTQSTRNDLDHRNQLNLKGTSEISIASLDPAPCKGKSHYLRLLLSKVRAQHSANSETGLRR
ncbi:hypothetical protein KEM48_002698 [Puccinia striiformis f. sp. tritici PST-130]|nr:hypothetical protein KEM48_002698 [Puccinia striiformis f. sp. tritici PST-130]